MLQDFSKTALGQYLVIVTLAAWMLRWTWRGCLREAGLTPAPDLAELASRYRRFRWVAIPIFAFGVLSILLPGAGKPYGVLLSLALIYGIAQLTIGYSGFLLAGFVSRRRRGAVAPK